MVFCHSLHDPYRVLLSPSTDERDNVHEYQLFFPRHLYLRRLDVGRLLYVGRESTGRCKGVPTVSPSLLEGRVPTSGVAT